MKFIIFRFLISIGIFLGSTLSHSQSSENRPISFGVGLGQYTLGASEYYQSTGTSMFGLKGKALIRLTSVIKLAPAIIYFSSTPTTTSFSVQSYLFELNLDFAVYKYLFTQAGFSMMTRKLSAGEGAVAVPAYDLGIGFRMKETIEIVYQLYLLAPKSGETLFTRNWIGASYVF